MLGWEGVVLGWAGLGGVGRGWEEREKGFFIRVHQGCEGLGAEPRCAMANQRERGGPKVGDGGIGATDGPVDGTAHGLIHSLGGRGEIFRVGL